MNTFGHSLRVSIFGESHGNTIGVLIDGCPAGLKIKENEFNTDLSRRRSGKMGTTPRKEPDKPEILSGIHKSYTTGAPITILFKNENTLSEESPARAMQTLQRTKNTGDTTIPVEVDLFPVD